MIDDSQDLKERLSEELAKEGLRLAQDDDLFQVQTLTGEGLTEWMELEDIDDWISDPEWCPFDLDEIDE